MGGRSKSSSSTTTNNYTTTNNATHNVTNTQDYQFAASDNRTIGNADIVEGNQTINAAGDVSVGSIVKTDHGAISGALSTVESMANGLLGVTEELSLGAFGLVDNAFSSAEGVANRALSVSEQVSRESFSLVDNAFSAAEDIADRALGVSEGLAANALGAVEEVGNYYSSTLSDVFSLVGELDESRAKQSEQALSEVSKLATVVQTDGESLKIDVVKYMIVGGVILAGVMLWHQKK